MKGTIEWSNAINCFTDASTTTHNGHSVSSSGYAVVFSDKIISNDNRIFYDASSNYGELYAIAMGVSTLANFIFTRRKKDPLYKPTVNIFSDSLGAVATLKDWVFEYWSHPEKTKNLIKYKYPIYKDFITEDLLYFIVNVISLYSMAVNFYHVSAHVSVSNSKAMSKMIKKFEKTNKVSLDSDAAVKLCYYNGFIDDMTRTNLKAVVNSPLCFKPDKYKKMSIPLESQLSRDTITNYATLVNSERI